MRRSAIACALALAGCSISLAQDHPTTTPDGRIECAATPAITDTAIAGGALIVALGFFSPLIYARPGSDARLLVPYVGIPAALAALIFGASAAYGWSQHATCVRVMRQPTD